MPQLNPAPWLAILVFSWLIFLTIIPPKILGHTSNNNLTSKKTKKPLTSPWNWPWH